MPLSPPNFLNMNTAVSTVNDFRSEKTSQAKQRVEQLRLGLKCSDLVLGRQKFSLGNQEKKADENRSTFLQFP